MSICACRFFSAGAANGGVNAVRKSSQIYCAHFQGQQDVASIKRQQEARARSLFKDTHRFLTTNHLERRGLTVRPSQKWLTEWSATTACGLLCSLRRPFAAEIPDKPISRYIKYTVVFAEGRAWRHLELDGSHTEPLARAFGFYSSPRAISGRAGGRKLQRSSNYESYRTYGRVALESEMVL